MHLAITTTAVTIAVRNVIRCTSAIEKISA
jgi:hypothetical protein